MPNLWDGIEHSYMPNLWDGIERSYMPNLWVNLIFMAKNIA